MTDDDCPKMGTTIVVLVEYDIDLKINEGLRLPRIAREWEPQLFFLSIMTADQ